ncbi:MAG: LLM class flavin-dependent oxidoreductase, partial [Candidatus Rokuibacteriota bacterium]
MSQPVPPSVSVGIHVPSSAVVALDSGEAYAEFFRQVESLGLDAVWTEDRIFHAAHMLDPLMLLASAAACTRRIELGTAVLVVTLRGAAVVARQVSTLHHLSGGRLALGVSLGGRPEEYQALGVPMNRRVTVFEESVAVIRKLLGGEPVDHEGPFVRLEQAIVRPPARVPLYLGGHAEGALRRAGALADGWIMGPFGTVRDFPRAWRVVQDAARAAGRNPGALVAGRLVYVAVDDDRGRARRALQTFLH